MSAVITLLDIALLATGRSLGWGVPLADAVAVAAASVVSWVLHRVVTFGDDPQIRWVRQPLAFVGTAVVVGAIDVFYTSLLPGPLWLTKVIGLGISGAVRVAAYRSILLSPLRHDLFNRQPDRPPSPGERRLTVVIPAYRESTRIASTIAQVRAALDGIDAELLVVDDGSPDDTAAVAAEAGARVVRLDPNRGKGAAVRSGMLAASGRTVAFTDADLAYPPEQLVALLEEIEGGWDVAVGNRWHPDSVAVQRPSALRQLSSRLFNLVTAAVLLGRYRDTQCGCKAFRSDAARLIFEHTRVDGFAFDVEVLHLVERYRLSLTEVPVQLRDGGESTVRVGPAALGMARDLIRVRRWAGRGVYDR
ncbi:MAG: glycosyltransferase [Acidobacteria bacterium]|nr:glycosyltransferase [Acidobacteriota bacterium]